MIRRITRSLVLGGALASAATLVISAQGAYSVPRTPWGDPDLQGMWTNETITPLERPVALGDKAFLTEEEAKSLESRATSDEEPPPRPGDTGAYNSIWLDSGDKVVADRRTSLVTEPKNGRVPLTPLAEKLRATDLERNNESWEYMSIWDRCISRGMPGAMMPAGYNNAYRIAQTPGYVVIYHEMIHDVRVIPIGDRPPLPAGIGLWNGDSRGRWEGDTLVVEVTNFNGRGWINTSAAGGRIKGIHHTPKLKVVERFRRISADIVDYQARIEDPDMFTEPWTVSIPLNRDDEYQLFEYACHEGNTAVANILSGGRAQEPRSKAAGTH